MGELLKQEEEKIKMSAKEDAIKGSSHDQQQGLYIHFTLNWICAWICTYVATYVSNYL